MTVPQWQPVDFNGPITADEINQFNALHQAGIVYKDTSNYSDIFGNLITYTQVGNKFIDQLVTVQSTSLDWIRLPITNQNLASPDNSSVYYQNAINIKVSIYANNNGQISGSPLKSTFVPSQIIETINNPSWPEPQDILFGTAVVDAQATLPSAPQSSTYSTTALSAGNWAIAYSMNTNSPGNGYVFYSQYNGSDLGGWIAGNNTPNSSLKANPSMVYCPTAQVLVFISGNQIWTATFTQNGVMGQWQAVSSPSFAIANIVGSWTGVYTYGGVDYYYVVGGYNSSTSVNGNNVYYTNINSDGSIGAWQTGSPFPITVGTSTQTQPSYGQVGNNFYFFAAGNNQINCLLTFPSDVWKPLELINGGGQGIVLDSTISPGYTVASSPNGTANWFKTQVFPSYNPNQSFFNNRDGSSTLFWWNNTFENIGNFPGYKQIAYPCTWVNVPINLSGLTSGTNYHVVIAGAYGNNLIGSQIPLVSGSNAFKNAQSSSSGAVNTWSSLPGCIPLMVFSDATGSPLAAFEDNGNRISYFYYDRDILIDAAQWSQQLNVTGTTVSSPGSPFIFNIASTTGIAPGMSVYGPGIPTGTTVSSASTATKNQIQFDTTKFDSTTDVFDGVKYGLTATSVQLNQSPTLSTTSTFWFGTNAVEAEVLGYTNGALTSITGLI
jgi:hypothetical protein